MTGGGGPAPGAFSAALSAAIDTAEAQAQAARGEGWPAIARLFEKLRDELIAMIPAEELSR